MKIDFTNGISVGLLLQDDQFRGLGEISAHGVPLRNSLLPVAPLIETLEGLRFRTFTFLDHIDRDDEVILRCRAEGEPGDYTEHTDLLHHRGLATHFPEKAPQAEIDWILRPVEAEIAGRRFVGLSYRYAYRCPDDKNGLVHQVVDRASWEIGGRAEGNTLISVGQANFPEHRSKRSSSFDNRIAQRGPDGERLHPGYASYETSPRFGTMQCFDYLFSDAGALAGYYEQMEHIRGLVEKQPDSDLILHFDEISFSLSCEFETPAKRVLFHQGEQPLDTTTGRNIWTDVHDHVADIYRSQYGIRAEEPVPEFSFGYDYDPVHRLHVVPEDSTNHLRRQGAELIPRLASLGIKRFFTSPQWFTDMTEVVTGGNCCLTWDYRVADRFGGDEALAALCRCANQAGIQVTVWIAFSLSDKSPLVARHPDWDMLSVTGAAYNAGCKDGVICIDQRSDFRQYLTRLILDLKRNTGIHGVLHDSFVHVPTMVINQANPTLEPSHRALLEMVAELQQNGLVYTVEGNGPFGLARGGLPHVADGGPEVMLQYFFGREYTLYNTTRNVSLDAVVKGILTPERYFRFLANKAPFCFESDSGRMDMLDCLKGPFAELHKIFNKVRSSMRRRLLLADDAGVEWKGDEGEQVIFSFKVFDRPVPAGGKVEEVTEGDPVPIAPVDGVFEARKDCVYRIHATHDRLHRENP